MADGTSNERSKKGPIRVGDLAPNFSLPAHDGTSRSLEDLLKDNVVVLFFYPKDDTSGCTAEACAFRDQFDIFAEAGARVVGISSDGIDSHKRFATRHSLPYTLLSDAGGKVRKLFGVPSTFGIIPGRATYVIDRNGIVRHVFSSQIQAERHVREALAVVKTLAA